MKLPLMFLPQDIQLNGGLDWLPLSAAETGKTNRRIPNRRLTIVAHSHGLRGEGVKPGATQVAPQAGKPADNANAQIPSRIETGR